MTRVHIMWEGDMYGEAAKKAMLAGMGVFMEAVASEGSRLAPIDTGTLRRSGHVEPMPNGWVASFNTPYALYQHEGLRFKHPRGGQAKYLSQPFDRMLPFLFSYLKGRL